MMPCCSNNSLEERSQILTKQPFKVCVGREFLMIRPFYLFSLFQTFLQVVGVVGVAVAVIPWITIPLIPLGIIFFVLRQYFLETSRDVKRLESTSESEALGLRWKRGPTAIYAVIRETSEMMQTLSSIIFPKFTLSYWVLWLLWVRVALKAHGAGSLPGLAMQGSTRKGQSNTPLECERCEDRDHFCLI